MKRTERMDCHREIAPKIMNNECSCKFCKNACRYKPGWFMPNEVEKVAKYLGISLGELFSTKLGVDWWEGGFNEPNIFLLAPATLSMSPGEEYPRNPKGQCIFFNKEGLCSIHPVKPFECKVYHHSRSKEVGDSIHEKVAMAWCGHDKQEQIRLLLGREPVSAEVGLFDLLM